MAFQDLFKFQDHKSMLSLELHIPKQRANKGYTSQHNKMLHPTMHATHDPTRRLKGVVGLPLMG